MGCQSGVSILGDISGVPMWGAKVGCQCGLLIWGTLKWGTNVRYQCQMYKLLYIIVYYYYELFTRLMEQFVYNFLCYNFFFNFLAT